MKRQLLLAVAFGVVLIIKGTGLGGAEQNLPPTGSMTMTIRGDGAQDPAQAAAAAAAARQAEAAAATAEKQFQEEAARERARQRTQEALRQQNRPLHDFGALTGPLSPTVPTGPSDASAFPSSRIGASHPASVTPEGPAS